MTDTINAAVPYLFAVNDKEGRRFTPNLAQLQQMNKDKVGLGSPKLCLGFQKSSNDIS